MEIKTAEEYVLDKLEKSENRVLELESALCDLEYETQSLKDILRSNLHLDTSGDQAHLLLDVTPDDVISFTILLHYYKK